jgi:uncharacterized membrane protein
MDDIISSKEKIMVETTQVVVATQSRWKSAVLWAAIAAQVIALGQMTGIWTAIGIDAGLVGDVVAGILQVLAIVGIINNPTDAKNW